MKQLILLAVLLAAAVASKAQEVAILKPSRLIVAKPYEFTAMIVTNRGDTLMSKSHSWKMIEDRVCMTTEYEGGTTYDQFVTPKQIVYLIDKKNTVITLPKTK